MARKKKNELEHFIHVEMEGDRYRLTVDLNYYYYPDVRSLVEGFLVHVALEREELISLEHFQHLMAIFKKGTAENYLKCEIMRLNNVIKEKNWQISDLKERNSYLWETIREHYGKKSNDNQ